MQSSHSALLDKARFTDAWEKVIVAVIGDVTAANLYIVWSTSVATMEAVFATRFL